MGGCLVLNSLGETRWSALWITGKSLAGMTFGTRRETRAVVRSRPMSKLIRTLLPVALAVSWTVAVLLFVTADRLPMRL